MVVANDVLYVKPYKPLHINKYLYDLLYTEYTIKLYDTKFNILLITNALASPIFTIPKPTNTILNTVRKLSAENIL